MCGLVGLFLPKNASALTADIPAMLDVIKHRGPDGVGHWENDEKSYQAGFARLAIIDLATGDQPLVDNEGDRVLMGNGEIYNYKELRQEAEGRGHRFKTTGDMESIFPLHQENGLDFIHSLNGMFGLALYEKGEHRITLVRDRLGIKPLYWSHLPGGGLLFASEIKALFASGLLEPAINERVVTPYLTHGYVPGPETLFKNVNKLMPGHWLRMDTAGEIAIQRYWEPRPADDLPLHPEEIKEHLTELLADSVRLRLRADVPVGALLSGGVDSGLMTALAAQSLERPLKTFSVRFQGAAYDETPLAALVAERYGTDHTLFELSTDAIVSHLPSLAWHAEEPLYDAALLPNQLIHRILAKEVTVVLNGTGGDEIFAGYGRYFQTPIEKRYLKLPGWLRNGVAEPLLGVADPMRAWQLSRAALFLNDRGQYTHDHATPFAPPMLKRLGHPHAAPEPAQKPAFDAFDGPPQTGALIADQLTYLPEDLLTLLDRTSSAASVEGRVPFLDYRLVEAALAVPEAVRTPGNRQKALERAMAEPYLPEELLTAPKQGFASPVPAWFAGGLGERAKRLLTRKQTLERGWWTRQGIDALFRKPEKHAFRLYTLLMLEMAVRVHVESPTAAAAPNDGLDAYL